MSLHFNYCVYCTFKQGLLFLVPPPQRKAGGWHMGQCGTTSLPGVSGGTEVRSVEPFFSSGKFKWKREFKRVAAGRLPSQKRHVPSGAVTTTTHNQTVRRQTLRYTHRGTHQRRRNLLPPVSCRVVLPPVFQSWCSEQQQQQQHCASGDSLLNLTDDKNLNTNRI